MKAIIKGKDYEILETDKNVIIAGKDYEKNETDKLKKIEDYFERYKNLTDKISPYNMGIYQTENEDELCATQYIGLLPLLKLPGKDFDSSESKSLNDDIIKVSSRFKISPSEMIEAILSGDDYYENPEMLPIRSYTISDWKDQKKNSEKNDENILFGLLNGVGQIELFSTDKGEQKVSQTDLGIVDIYGIFEIIDFVNKAKKLCKGNLKRQSCRIEENLNCKVKGRILVQKQIKYNVSKGQEQRFYCVYNKMSENIKENQIIKYALTLCVKKSGIGDALAEDLRFCLNTLGDVALKKCGPSDFIGLKNNSAYRQYKEALAAAKKVICRYSLSYLKTNKEFQEKSEQKSELKSGKVQPYFIDINLLFEYYCRAIFKKAIAEYNKEAIAECNKEEKSTVRFELESSAIAERNLFDEHSKVDKYYMKNYYPDIVINYIYKEKKDIAAVFDAKNSDVRKAEWKKRERTHQIMFYMKALGCNQGGLISSVLDTNKDELISNFYANISKDEILKDDICINSIKSEKKKQKDDNNKIILYYIPLLAKEEKDFERFVIITKVYLQAIANKVELEQLEKRKSGLLEEFFELNSGEKGKNKNSKDEIKDIKGKIEKINGEIEKIKGELKNGKQRS